MEGILGILGIILLVYAIIFWKFTLAVIAVGFVIHVLVKDSKERAAKEAHRQAVEEAKRKLEAEIDLKLKLEQEA